MVRKSSLVYIFVFMFIQTALFSGITVLNITSMSNIQKQFDIYKIPQQITFSSNSTKEVYGKSFYRFTTILASLSNVGNTTFDMDVWLIGLSVRACGSMEQNYELLISGEFVQVAVDENWIGVFKDYVGKAYFASLIDTMKGKLQDVQFLPQDYGFYIPKGEMVYFTMWSPKLGNGGLFTLYWVEA